MLDTKIVLLNATTFWRSTVLVVGPQTMSTVPFSTSGICVPSWTGCSRISREGSFNSALIASTTRPQSSTMKPTGFPFPSR